VALVPSTMATRAVTVPLVAVPFIESVVLVSVRLMGRTASTAEPLEVSPAPLVSGTVATETESSGGPVEEGRQVGQ
jgi:hypothetical protein